MQRAFALAVVFVSAGIPAMAAKPRPTPSPTPTATPNPCAVMPCRYQQVRYTSPNRTDVLNAQSQWLGTFTDNSYSVKVKGPTRTFSEPLIPETTGQTQYTVTTFIWVRLMASKFVGTVDENWLDQQLASTSPDILAMSMQYIAGAPPIFNGSLQIAGDSAYGSAAGADFNDYLGVTWAYGSFGGNDAPESAEFREMDCSGFIRMLFGYRESLRTPNPATNTAGGITLAAYSNNRPGLAVPRVSADQCNPSVGTGVYVVPYVSGQKPSSYGNLTAGDYVCFDADSNETGIDHLGIFLGVDSGGHYRFISSRNSLKGPTMNDSGVSVTGPPCYSPSTLDGCGWAPDGWRSAVRP